MKPGYAILLMLMNLLWAASYSAFKVLAPYLSSGQIATWRYLLAGLVMLILWPMLPGKAPSGRDLLRIFFMGAVVFAFGTRFQVSAVHIGQAGDVSLLMALDPLVNSLAAAWFLRERVAPRRWFGCALGMGGVFLLSECWRADYRMAGLWSGGLILLNFICESAYSIVGKPLILRAGLLKVVALAFFAGAMVNLAFELVLGGGRVFTAAYAMPLEGWLILLYLSLVCSVAGYSLWYFVIRETQVNVTALTIFMQPVAGLFIAVLWLGEPFHWGQLWGSLVIVAGLIVGLRGRSAGRTPLLTPIPDRADA
jgi:drug/metabolite transporter (DMT)-like permease